MQASNSDILESLQELETAKKEAAAAEEARKKAERELAAKNPQKIRRFGAALDEDIAGSEPVERTDATEEHIQLFDRGNALMQRGEYKAAVTAFTQATASAPGGLTGRRGGQYAVYLAQALQASGRKPEAAKLLKRCEGHPDRDVRKISSEVLYILQAPELKLDSDQFVSIPKLPERDDWGAGREVREEKDPPPEKYSLEWYVLQKQLKDEGMNRKPVEKPPPSPVEILVYTAFFGGFLALITNFPF